MGLFDFLGKNDSKKKTMNSFNEFEKLQEGTSTTPAIQIYYPKDYSEVASIIDQLKLGRNVIVNLNSVSEQSSKRILDFLSGAVYALGGGVCEMQKDSFLFSPNGVELK